MYERVATLHVDLASRSIRIHAVVVQYLHVLMDVFGILFDY